MVKKRLFAFLLVVVLTMALMLPTLAATVEPHAVNCDHVWERLQYSNYRYIDYDGTYHRYAADISFICNKCANTKTETETIRMERHFYSPAQICVYCGHKKA